MKLKTIGILSIAISACTTFGLLAVALFVFAWPASVSCFVGTVLNGGLLIFNLRRYQRNREMGLF